MPRGPHSRAQRVNVLVSPSAGLGRQIMSDDFRFVIPAGKREEGKNRKK